jgi:RimJ/RimL family protein N-acetyltransferase
MNNVIPVRLRPTTMNDARILLEWRNDPETRAQSHQIAEVSLQEHLGWLNKILDDPHRKLCIATLFGMSVGTVRADLADVTRLSWTVAPSHRGKGLGKEMVLAMVRDVGGPVRAEVKRGNIPSIRICEFLGMRLVRHDGDILHFSSV